MPCAGPDYSCNSLITIRSPLGEMRIGAPQSAAPSSRPVWFLAKMYLQAREWLAHRAQRAALTTLDERLRDDIGISERDATRESRRPFWK
jgi:uncharacterized protein YjiS (DUF1127 family)